MTTLSNLYAEKVFAEHPISLWSLDDSVDYSSLIDETGRDMSVWEKTANVLSVNSYATEEDILGAETPLGFPRVQFANSYTNEIVLNALDPNQYSTETLTSDQTFSQDNFNNFIETFAIGAYVYPFSREVTVSIGFTYLDENNDTQYVKKSFSITKVATWAFISSTFDLPKTFSFMKIVVGITYSSESEYSVLVNGLSFGQQSEQFHVESLGTNLIDINDDLSVPVFQNPTFGSIAYSYGLQSLNGYYLANSYGTLSATNSGMPLVFGAYSSTQLRQNDPGMPSLIVPGFGFLNNSGKHKDLTLEAWIRVQSKTTEKLRILGPVASNDGLYINDSFFILKVGNVSGTYYINEWDRPMLISVRYGGDLASLTINGEEVILLDLSSTQVSLPSKTIKINDVTYDQDWIGFYAYEDIPMIEVDCIGVYPYSVPAIMQKRRWIYGQGVSTPPGLSSAELTSSIAADFTVSNYSMSYAYPDFGRWRQGVSENLIVDSQIMSLPKYELPDIVLSNRVSADWYEDMQGTNGEYGPFMRIIPSSTSLKHDWSTTTGYFLFNSLNMMSQDTKAFYGLFRTDPNNHTKQTLFYVENQVTKDALEISLNDGVIEYSIRSLNVDGTMSEPEVLYTNAQSATLHTLGQFLFVGIEINKFTKAFGGKTLTLFGNKKQLRVYVGGEKTMLNTYTGDIYRVGFSTARNLMKIYQMFSDNGIAAENNSLDSLPEYIMDAGNKNFTNTSSYVDTETGNTYWSQTLDGGDSYFGNLNTEFEELVDGGSVNSILVDKILDHIASYTLVPKLFLGTFSIDVAVNGYWQDYVPLSYFGKFVGNGGNAKHYDFDFLQYNVSYPAIKKFLNNKYDASSSVVRTYISFDYIKNKSTVDVAYYNGIVYANSNNVVEPDQNWYRKLYEITDNTVIYPPPNVDFKSVAIVLHIEVLSRGIVENPVRIQSLQLSSQSLNSSGVNSLGTKYGHDIYPYRKAGVYFDYKARNPYTIYKSNMPYLYLTEKSGLKTNEWSGSSLERGISIPINKNKVTDYAISGVQFSARYTGEKFSSSIKEIMQIQSNVRFTKIYMRADSSNAQRARLFAIDAYTGMPETNVKFYINGRLVNTPIININSWQTIGMMFAIPEDFSEQVGAIRMTGPLTWNNFLYFRSPQVDWKRSVYRKWFSILTVDSNDVNWNYWYDTDPNTTDLNATWRDILYVSTEDPIAADGKIAYQKYTGTDRIIIESQETFRLNNYQYAAYSNLTWSTSSITPA